MEAKKPMNIDRVIARVKYFVENLDELVIKQIDPVKKAQFFGLIFRTLPTYDDLVGRNQNSPLFTGVNPLFQAIMANNFPLVTPRRPLPKHFWDGLDRLGTWLEELEVE